MSFNYEQSIWGKGEASLRWSDPTSFRLKQSLKAIKNLPSGARVLEVGTGAGQFTRALKKIRPELHVYGCDISREAIEYAVKTEDGVVYALSTPEKLPYDQNFFDAVLIFDVLEHVEDVDGTLQEIYRVLKPQGLLYCFVPCEGDWLSLWHLLEKLHLKRNLTQRYAGHINYFSRRELRNQLHKHHLELVSARYGEHVLGQLLGVISFTLMHRTAQKKQLSQLNNETFFAEKTEQSGGWYQVVKNVINSLIYLESLVGSWIPSPNVHYVVRKKV